MPGKRRDVADDFLQQPFSYFPCCLGISVIIYCCRCICAQRSICIWGVTSLNSIRYDKLVRDRIPEVIRQAGKQPVTDDLPRKAMSAALDRKLQEEVQEYLESGSIEEMADVLEVLHGIAFHKGISWDEVESVRLRKREERGGFEKGIMLLEVKEL